MSNQTDDATARVPLQPGPRPPRGGHCRSAVRIALAALGFRLISAFLALCANLAFPLARQLPPQSTVWGRTSPFWDAFARFDTGYYESIAWGGYAPLAGGRSNIAYFPVYPMLMRLVGRLFGRQHAHYYIAGIAVSWVCFILAMIALYHLARLDLPRRRAERAVLLTAIFPFAFFFGVAYSESTFLLFTVLAFYLFRTRRWMLGGMCGALATATRVPGILMVPALAWVAWRSAEPTTTERTRAAAGVALSAAGFAAYCWYIYSLT